MWWRDVLKPGLRTDQLLGVPYAAQDTSSYKVMLAFDAYETLLTLQGLIKSLDEQIEIPDLMRATRDRLKAFKASNEEHLSTLARMLMPLGYKSLLFTEYDQYISRRASGNILMGHYEHLFRDWAEWGERENAITFDIAKRAAKDIGKVGSVLTLGAGACRLPYELHRWLKPEHSLCVDYNPFLLSCAQTVIGGERISLIDFPPVPRDINSYAVKRELRAPEAVKDIDFLVHDLEEWGFREESFDLVVTPWFIDVIHIPTRRLFSLINQVLKKGGYWLNLGPTGFNTRELSKYYSPEEVMFLVKKSGFNVLGQESAPVPYFQDNAASSHGRTEHVLAFLAKKDGSPGVIPAAEPSDLPPWIEDVTRPVELPVDPAVLRKSHAFCLALLDRLGAGGPATVQGLAQSLAADYGLSEDEAQYLISHTLMQWRDSAKHNPMKFSRG